MTPYLTDRDTGDENDARALDCADISRQYLALLERDRRIARFTTEPPQVTARDVVFTDCVRIPK